MGKSDLLELSPLHFRQDDVSLEEILRWFKYEEAYWEYEGEPSAQKPHAELTSGLCSNGYFDVPRVTRYPNVAEILGRQLGRKAKKENIGRVDWVVSSAYSAITFGHEVAKELGAIFLSVEKDPADPNGKRMIWRRQTIPAQSRVLQVEELISTSGTFREVRRAVEEGNAEPIVFLPEVLTLIHRPKTLPMGYDGRQVIALVEKAIDSFTRDDCPYHKAGSVSYPPKTYWWELTGKS